MTQSAVYTVLNPYINKGMKYRLLQEIHYYSKRYKKWVFVPAGSTSDGATGAKDLPESISWWVHDQLCKDAEFFDGTECSAWQASMVLRDILFDEGYSFRARSWTWATFLFGSWKNKRKVGWFK
jgi:hypothetical protein